MSRVQMDWDSNTYGLSYYPMFCDEIFDKNKKAQKLLSLSKKKQKFIQEQHKYQLRSYFLNHNYSFSTKWEFIGLKVDPYYRQGKKSYHLKCDCGRSLKYQYVVQSVKTGKRLKLGISHFKDHLNITDELANEIKRNIHKVDLAINELLWLETSGYKFPTDLWNRYLYAIYINQKREKPVKLNSKLAYRVKLFEQMNMPIFINDYKQLKQEINVISKHQIQLSEEFSKFKCDISETFNWLVCEPTDWNQFPVEQIDDVLNERFFSDLVNLLKKSSAGVSVEELDELIEDCENEYTSIDFLMYMLTLNREHGFRQEFYKKIPDTYSKGIAFDIELSQQSTAVVPNYKLITQDLFSLILLNSNQLLDQETKKYLKEHNLIISTIVEALALFVEGEPFEYSFKEHLYTAFNEMKYYFDELKEGYLRHRNESNFFTPSIVSLYLDWLSLEKQDGDILRSMIALKNDGENPVMRQDSDFYNKLFLILMSANQSIEEKTIVQLSNLFSMYQILDWELGFNLIEAIYSYQNEGDFSKSFEKVEEIIRKELDDRFQNKCFYIEI